MQTTAPLCYYCIYYKSPKPGQFQCKAFPSKIPKAILNSLYDHRKPYPGDNGIQFSPTEHYENKYWDAFFNR